MTFLLAKFFCLEMEKLMLCRMLPVLIIPSSIHYLLAYPCPIFITASEISVFFYKFENHYIIKDAIMPPSTPHPKRI